MLIGLSRWRDYLYTSSLILKSWVCVHPCYGNKHQHIESCYSGHYLRNYTTNMFVGILCGFRMKWLLKHFLKWFDLWRWLSNDSTNVKLFRFIWYGSWIVIPCNECTSFDVAFVKHPIYHSFRSLCGLVFTGKKNIWFLCSAILWWKRKVFPKNAKNIYWIKNWPKN